MTQETLESIKRWFRNYVNDFISEENMHSRHMIQIKLEHSLHVGITCSTLAGELQWPENEIMTAEALGLLHDVGRFSQFSEYGTFMDADSVNHGKRGYEVVKQSAILSCLSEKHRRSILDGILYHNCLEIPLRVQPESLPFVKLVRDADKVDIFRVIDESIRNNQLTVYITEALNIQPDGPVNRRVLDDIRKNRTVSNKHVKSLADFYLMLLSWVYDINYSPTVKHIFTSNIFGQIACILPEDREVREVSKSLLASFNDRVKKG